MNLLKLSDYLSKEEIEFFHTRSNWLAGFELIKTWGWVAIAFAIVFFFPNAITVMLALFILGGKQLGCAIIMHDAGHHSLFRTKKQNEWLGNVFGAWPIFHNVEEYGPYHRRHHLHAGLEDDPDLLLTRGYPTTRASMFRKFARDLFGITGVKAFLGLIMMHLGFLEYNLGNKIVKTRPKSVILNFYNRLSGPLLANGTLWLILYSLGNGWLYLLWIGAYLTTFQFSLRIRSMAEHSMVPDSSNPKANSRTVRANEIEKLLFAPLNVNYHSEHHLAMSVPSYRLPELRRRLAQRDKLDYGLTEPGYLPIVKKAMQQG
jgi:fatty acid desaturase